MNSCMHTLLRAALAAALLLGCLVPAAYADGSEPPATSEPLVVDAPMPTDASAAAIGAITPAPEVTAAPAASGEPEPTESPLSPVSAIDVMCEPCGILALDDGSLLVTDVYGKTVLQVTDGVSTVYAGAATVEDIYGEPLGGYVDGSLENSFFRLPWAVAPYIGGYAVTDRDNNAIRVLLPEGVKTINTETGENLTTGDMGVVFASPTGLAADNDGNLYVSDTQQNAIRKIDSEGNVSTITSALTGPTGLYWKGDSLYVAETGANRIVRISGDGRVMVIAGGGQDGMNDGPSALASFSSPQGVAVDDNGVVYVADTANSAIRRIENGVVDTLLVRDTSELEENAPISPVGMTVVDGQLYVCDSFARQVLVIDLEQ